MIPIQTFTIAPTSHVFERFQKHDRDLGHFFELSGIDLKAQMEQKKRLWLKKKNYIN